jgi:hypothetical protein
MIAVNALSIMAFVRFPFFFDFLNCDSENDAGVDTISVGAAMATVMNDFGMLSVL